VADFRRYLDHVATETARCGRIVSDLLAFSRRPAPQRTGNDLGDVVRRTVPLLAHKLDLEGATIEFDLADDLPLVPCDAAQIQQIVINLLMNAAEAMPDGGVVVVRTRASGDQVLLEVSDRGVGIPEHLQGRVFDPFFTTKEEGKGTGLGLAVVFGIVEAHGGSIDLESKVGEGTTFRVSLPIGASDEKA
jgi:two-component system NtrC family sensor kinase